MKQSNISTTVRASLNYLQQQAREHKSEADIKGETDEIKLPISIAHSIITPTTVARTVVDVVEHIITVYDKVAQKVPGVPFMKVVKGPWGIPLAAVPCIGPEEIIFKSVARNVVIPATYKVINVVEDIEKVATSIIEVACKLAYNLCVDDITLACKSGKLQVTITLTAGAEVTKINFGGILKPSVKGALKGSGSIKAVLTCSPTIKSDLSLELADVTTDLKWIKQPHITALNTLSIPLMDLLMPGVSLVNQRTLDFVTSLVSKFIHFNPSFPMKSHIQKAWDLLHNPIAISEGAFLVCSPSKVVIEKLELDDRYLQTRAQLVAATKVYLQDTPPSPSTPGPLAAIVGSVPISQSHLLVSATVSFAKLTERELSMPGITLASRPHIQSHPTVPNRITCSVSLASPFAINLQVEGTIALDAENEFVHLTNVTYTLPPSVPVAVIILDATIRHVIINAIQNTVRFSFAQYLQEIYDKIACLNVTLSDEPKCVLRGASERPKVTSVTSDSRGVHVQAEMVVNQLELTVE